MGNSSSPAKILASLFRLTNEVRPVLLLGAGASFRSGIPLAAEAVKRIAKAAYTKNVLGGRVHPVQVKLTEWLPWLRNHPWFIDGEERLPENFPLAIEHLLRPAEFRREVLLELTEPIGDISPGYHTLADFMLRGLVWTILTTNFDRCLPRALEAKQPHLKYVSQVNRGINDFAEFSVWNQRQIVWLHGRAEQYTDRNLEEEVAHLDESLASLLRPLLNDSPLVVIGYRGAEPSIMDDLLMAGLQSSQNFRNGIYWCTLPHQSLHPNVERLDRLLGRNFHLLEIEGFDELMSELAVELKGEDSYASTRGLSAALQPPQAFDEQPLRHMGLDELDQDLMLTTLREYCQTVGRAPVTQQTLLPLLRELGLVRTIDLEDVPTIACCLLFASSLPERLRHAAIYITRNGKKKIVVAGNLLRQRRELIDLLDSEEINPTLKVKRQRTYEERSAYPSRTLTELVVNLLVHRDYQVPEVAEIEIDPGRAIRFRNAGGIDAEMKDRFQIDDTGRFRPVRSLSSIRNPSVATSSLGCIQWSALVQASPMSRSKCGVRAAMRSSASTGITNFSVQSCTSPAGGPWVTNVASPVSPMGIYTLNLLRLSVLPEHVSVARLGPDAIQRLIASGTPEFPTYLHHADELWSFAPAELLESRLANRAEGEIVAVKRSEIEADPERRNLLSWLLRKHWENFLRRFRDDGLFIEQKKRRAYFRKLDNRRTTIRYDSAKRRGVVREVVKPRLDGKWHENEGIGYEVVSIDERWFIRVKPFYMFTRKDGATPLPGFERTRRATRRMKFDRNKSVDDDLSFWGRYLGRGNSTVNIGGRDVDDLLLETSFLTIEVCEKGLLEEPGDGSTNRLPAGT